MSDGNFNLSAQTSQAIAAAAVRAEEDGNVQAAQYLRAELARRSAEEAGLSSITGESLSRSVTREGFQGLTAGFGDEISGALGASAAWVGDDIPEGQGWSDAYTDIRDAERRAEKLAWDSAEGADMALLGGARVAGSLVPATVGAKALTGLQSVRGLPAAQQAMTLGAAEGAVFGLGESEAGTPGGVVGDVAIGVGAGLAGGVLGQGAAAMAKWSAAKLRNAFTGVVQSQDTQARSIIEAVLHEADMTPDDAVKWLTDNPGKVLGEHPSMVQFTRGRLSGTPAGSPLASVAFDNAIQRQHGKTMNLVRRMFTGSRGVDMGDFDSVRAGLTSSAKLKAKPFYDELYKHGTPVEPGNELDDFLQQGHIKELLRESERVVQMDPDAVTNLILRPKPGANDLSTGDSWEYAAAPGWRELDRLQRSMRRKAGALREAAIRNPDRSGLDIPEAMAWDKNRRKLLEMLYAQGDLGPSSPVDGIGPRLKVMHREYAQAMDIDDAYDKGVRIFRNAKGDMNFEGIRTFIGNASPGEREAFQLGALNSMRDGLLSTGENKTLAKLAMFDQAEGKMRLTEAFGDQTPGLLAEIRKIGVETNTARLLNPNSLTSTSATNLFGERLLPSTSGVNGTLALADELLRSMQPIRNAQVTQKMVAPMLKHDPAAFANFMAQHQPFTQRVGDAVGLGSLNSVPSMWAGISGAATAPMAVDMFGAEPTQ